MAERLRKLAGERDLTIAPRRSFAEEAAEELRKLILLEQLPPGAPISERELTEILGISRTPLREALRMLELQGLIEYSRTRRPFVADPSLEEVSQLIDVLAALEALAGERTCGLASDAEIEAILSLERRMKAESDVVEPLEFFRMDMDFHARIVAASRNQPLIETHSQYNARLWRARFISSRREERRERTLAEHSQIADALARRDAAAIAAALRGHLGSTIQNIADVRAESAAAKKDEEA